MKTMTSLQAQNSFGELIDTSQARAGGAHPSWAPGVGIDFCQWRPR